MNFVVNLVVKDIPATPEMELEATVAAAAIMTARQEAQATAMEAADPEVSLVALADFAEAVVEAEADSKVEAPDADQ